VDLKVMAYFKISLSTHNWDRAIEKRGPGLGYQVDAERCTGCGACHDQCPCHAIELRQPEESQ
ncbi:4Fe-4S binding protein, partial [Aeromonas jandaei]